MCGTEGGTRIDVGLDNGDGSDTANDGILGPDEIDDTFYSCNGADGNVGPQGPQGPAGADGADGAVGPRGPQGEQGPVGATGAQGPQGEQGPAGDDGADGSSTAERGVWFVFEFECPSTVTCSGKTSCGGGVKFITGACGLIFSEAGEKPFVRYSGPANIDSTPSRNQWECVIHNDGINTRHYYAGVYCDGL